MPDDPDSSWRKAARFLERRKASRATRRQLNVDRILIEAAAGYRQSRMFASTVRALSWYAQLGYAVAMENSPGGAAHLAWQRVQPFRTRVARWKSEEEMLAYVLGYAVGSLDAGRLTSEELDEMVNRLRRRGVVVVD